MKTNRRHHVSEEEMAVWVLIAILFALTLLAGWLFWQKLAVTL